MLNKKQELVEKFLQYLRVEKQYSPETIRAYKIDLEQFEGHTKGPWHYHFFDGIDEKWSRCMARSQSIGKGRRHGNISPICRPRDFSTEKWRPFTSSFDGWRLCTL